MTYVEWNKRRRMLWAGADHERFISFAAYSTVADWNPDTRIGFVKPGTRSEVEQDPDPTSSTA